MNKLVTICATALAFVMTTNASAQLGSLLFGKFAAGQPPKGVAGGTYQSNDQIRTFITAGANDNIDLYGKMIVKAGEMAKAKGFANFAVTKYNCSTTLMGNTPIAKGCNVIAIMLNDGVEAKPRGARKVYYYRVDDVLEGRIARPAE